MTAEHGQFEQKFSDWSEYAVTWHLLDLTMYHGEARQNIQFSYIHTMHFVCKKGGLQYVPL